MNALKRQRGFTLVELMIATGVFAVVITLGMYGFIQVNRFYTKSLTIIRTQDAVRNLVTDISNQLQLTTGQYQSAAIAGTNIKMVCIGNKAYAYQLNIIEGGSNHAITSYEVAANTCPTQLPASPPTHLLRPGVRVLEFNIVPYPNSNGPLFNIKISLLYAPKDDDTPAGTDLVQIDAADPNNYSKWRCTATVKGSQYCSLSTIGTSVYKRAP